MRTAIVGGGFAGRMAAARLRRAGHEVVLVDAQAAFVERTRLHETAAHGERYSESHADFAQRIGASFVLGRVVGVRSGRLTLENGPDLQADGIVVSAGSVPDRSVAGVREFALSLGGPKEALEMARRLRELPAGGRVVVVGAGLTGLELATEIAEVRPDLHLELLGDPLRDRSARGRKVVSRALTVLGIHTQQARVQEVQASQLITDQGSLKADLVLWTAGMRVPAWLAASGMPLDADGRVAVDDALAVRGMPGVVAAGDCAGTELRMACATAMPMGCHAAQTLDRMLCGKPTRPMHFGYFMHCISLGRKRGLVDLTHKDDQPRGIALGGSLGATLKEQVLVAARDLPAWEAKSGLPLYGWPAGPTVGRPDRQLVSAA